MIEIDHWFQLPGGAYPYPREGFDSVIGKDGAHDVLARAAVGPLGVVAGIELSGKLRDEQDQNRRGGDACWFARRLI